MPHKGSKETASNLLGQAVRKLAMALRAKEFYGPIAPLYLNKKNVYGAGSPAAGQDPIRPYFGHWDEDTAIGDSVEDTLLHGSLPGWTPSPGALQDLVFDGDAGPYTASRFIKPGRGFKAPGPAGAESRHFRVLANRKIRTASTAPSLELEAWKAKYDSLATAVQDLHGLDLPWAQAVLEGLHDMDPATDPLSLTAASAMEGLPTNSYLPHYHEGYVDEHGNGFTTGVFIDEAWLGAQELIAYYVGGYGGPAGSVGAKTAGELPSHWAVHPGNPPHHTHRIFASKYAPDTSWPSFSWVQKQGYLADAGHNARPVSTMGQSGGPATVIHLGLGIHKSTSPSLLQVPGGTQWDETEAIIAQQNQKQDMFSDMNVFMGEEIEEVIFLEHMELYYNNDYTAWKTGWTFKGAVTKKYEFNINRVSAMQADFVKHIDEEYGKKVAKPQVSTKTVKPGAIEFEGGATLGTGDAYSVSISGQTIPKVYTDTVFQSTRPDDENPFTSKTNYINAPYEDAINILSNQQLLLIPNPYLLHQWVANRDKFYLQSDESINTIHGALLTAGGNAKYLDSADKEYMHASNFPKIIPPEAYMRLWSTILNPHENESISVPGVNNNKILGFQQSKFLKTAKPNTKWTWPWEINITINAPPTIPFFHTAGAPDNGAPKEFLKEIFRTVPYGPIPVSHFNSAPMSLLMTLAANGQFILHTGIPGTNYSWWAPPAKEGYWKREVYSKDSIEVNSWDLTMFTKFIDSDILFTGLHNIINEKNDLVSFDYKQTSQPDVTWAMAFSQLRDEISKLENTRSVYEILSPPWTAVDPAEHGGLKGLGYQASPFAHNEMMFYEIEKSKNGQVVQRIFIAVDEEQGPMEYIDTQIKINEGYDYTIYAYILTVGNEYQYQGIEPLEIKHKEAIGECLDPDTGEWKACSYGPNVRTFDVVHGGYKSEDRPAVAEIYAINKPKIKLLKIPYIKFPTLYATDAPPLYPNVEISSYKGINNKLLFLLDQYMGEHKAVPIPILPGDHELFNKIKLAQQASDQWILFKTDDLDYKYQVFRLEQHPTDWSDFSTALRKEMDPYKTDFIDNIIPNKKYYYMFRTIDRHGHISNPSPIFEIELIDDHGAIYLNTKVVDFVEKVLKEDTKSMRKYIHIAPTMKQSNLSAPKADSVYSAEGLPHDVSLGSLFGNSKNHPTPRRFKVRFTSKTSGKMFDLNLNFIHEHEGIIWDWKKETKQWTPFKSALEGSFETNKDN